MTNQTKGAHKKHRPKGVASVAVCGGGVAGSDAATRMSNEVCNTLIPLPPSATLSRALCSCPHKADSN